jgi:nitrite reductase (NO-forming)
VRGAADRVRRSHAQTRSTLRLTLLFLGAAGGAAAIGEPRWVPLHLLLAGGVVLAISGVSLMLTVTWSAAPAPADRAALVQRWCIAAGAAGVVAGRRFELVDAVVGVAGTVHLAGLLLLAALLLTTVRRGVERRFDAAVTAYLLAIVAGVGGVALGVAMAVDGASSRLRAGHLTLNLLGLVGLVVAGTMPFFAAPVVRARMAPHATSRRILMMIGWQAGALAVAVAGVLSGTVPASSAGLAAYSIGIVGALWLLPRPTRRQLQWAGPRLLGLWAGALWWAVAVAVTAGRLAADAGAQPFSDRWLAVLVVAGYAQILWGSLAYLLPMLRGGGHERLAQGFVTTRSWPGLAAVNVAGFGFAAGSTTVAAGAVAAFLVDGAWRAGRLTLDRRGRRQQGVPTAPGLAGSPESGTGPCS